MIVIVIWGAIEQQFLEFWPFYLLIPLLALLIRFKDDFTKYGSICAALIAFAYVMYQSEQPATVIVPFTTVAQGEAAELPFSGETVANVVRDGLDAIGEMARQQPGRFPCANSPAPSDILRTLNPQDASLGIDLQPAFSFPEATATTSVRAPESINPEPVTLEVKGISLNALLVAARTAFHTDRVISGDIVVDKSGSFFIVARSNDGKGPWTVGPYAATREGLQNAGCEMGQYIMKDINPNLLGEAYINSNRSTEAFLLYNDQVSADVKYTHEALMLDGAARMQAKAYGAALKKFDEALQADRHDPKTLESLGLAYAGTGDFDNAFRQFDLALQCTPLALKCPSLLLSRSLQARNEYERGVSYFLKRDYKSSIEAFQRSLKFRPEYPAAAFYLGWSFLENKQYSEAIKAYQHGLESKPAHPLDSAMIELQMGNAFDLGNQPDNAIVAYEQTRSYFASDLTLGPENLSAYYGYALISLRIGTVQAQNHRGDAGAAAFDQAANALTHILSVNPQFPGVALYLAKAHVLLGDALSREGKEADSIKEFSKAISEIRAFPHPESESTDAILDLSVALVLRGNASLASKEGGTALDDSSAAIDALSRIADRSPQIGAAHEWMARALTLRAHLQIERREYQDAITGLNKALNLHSTYPEATIALVQAYIGEGDQFLTLALSAQRVKDLDAAQSNYDQALALLARMPSATEGLSPLLGAAYLGRAKVFVAEDHGQDAKDACDEGVKYYRSVPATRSMLPRLQQFCSSLGKAH